MCSSSDNICKEWKWSNKRWLFIGGKKRRKKGREQQWRDKQKSKGRDRRKRKEKERKINEKKEMRRI